MNDTPTAAPLPPDDSRRKLTHVRPEQDVRLPHIAVVGDTYTILVRGEDTAGRYCLIDMYVGPGGGPPPHRHDFEEMFTLLEGELAFTFRGETTVVRAGRAGCVFPGRRRPGREPDRAAACGGRGRQGGAHDKSPGARVGVPDRVSASLDLIPTGNKH